MASIASWAARAARSAQTRGGGAQTLSAKKGRSDDSAKREHQRKRDAVQARRDEAYQSAMSRAGSNNVGVMRQTRDRKARTEGRRQRAGGGMQGQVPEEIVTAGSGEVITRRKKQMGPLGRSKANKDVWADIYAYEQDRLTSEIEAKKFEKEKRAEKLSAQLNTQVVRKKTDLFAVKDDMVSFAQQQSKDVEAWKVTMVKKREDLLRKNQQRSVERELQCADTAQRKAAAERERILEELDVVARNNADLEDEKERKREMAREGQRRMERVKLANAANLERKRQVKIEKAEYEKKLGREYTEMMDKQEWARSENLRKIAERQKKLGKVGAVTAGQVEKKHNEDEARAQRWRDKYEIEADLRIKAKKARQDAATQDQVDALDLAVRDKAAKKAREAVELRKFAQEQNKKQATLLAQDDHKVFARREKNLNNQDAIRVQMREHNAKKLKAKAPMSDMELALNKDLLRKVAEFKASKRNKQQKNNRKYRISNVPL